MVTFSWSRTFGRPPRRPLALATLSPAAVRSRINDLSNSEIAPKTWKINFPLGLVVSSCWVMHRNPIPRFSRSFTDSMRCFKERESRSSFQTTKTSPSRAYSIASFNLGRSSFAPDATSSKIFSHPASLSAWIWSSRFWSEVLILQYPMFMWNIQSGSVSKGNKIILFRYNVFEIGFETLNEPVLRKSQLGWAVFQKRNFMRLPRLRIQQRF